MVLASAQIGILLNTQSGSCDANAEADILHVFESKGLNPARVWCGGAEVIDEALAALPDFDVMIVLGGDGTIRAAAERCGASKPLLVPLPGGTMNILPKALYGDRNWREALRATLDAPTPQRVSGGRIGKHQFFVTAILGNPALWADVREAVREGDLGTALTAGQEALEQAFSRPLRYDFGAEQGEAEAVSILCPLTSIAMEDDELSFEVATIATPNALSALKLGLTSLVSGWRADANISTSKRRIVTVEADEVLFGLLDGESVELGSCVRVEFIPSAFQALVPAPAPELVGDA